MIRCRSNHLFRRSCPAPPVDIDASVNRCGSLMYGNNIISGVVLLERNRSSLLSHLGNFGFTDEWAYNGGPFQLVVFHFLIAIYAYMGREWELSYRLGICPWSVWGATPLSSSFAVFLVYLSVKVLSLTIPWVSLVHSTTCWSSSLSTTSDHPSTCWELVSSVVHCSPRCTVHWLPPHWFVKPLRMSPRTTVTSSVKKKRPTTSSFPRLLRVSSSNTPRSTTHVPSLLPQARLLSVSGSPLWVCLQCKFNLNGFNFNQSIVESQGKVINTWGMSQQGWSAWKWCMRECLYFLHLAAESLPKYAASFRWLIQIK